MAFKKELDEAQAYLRGKLTDRRKSMEVLIGLLSNEEVVTYIDTGLSITWRALLEDSQNCLKTECDRIGVLIAKKGPLKSPDKNFELSTDLLMLVVKTALCKGDENISISSFIKYIEACLRDRTMRCCKDTFLRMVKDFILPNRDCLGCLEPEDFVVLFGILRTELEATYSESKNLTIFSSFALLIKYGPFAAFPPNFLRQQFTFFSSLCQSVTQNDPRILQEDVIDIILNFCKHTSEDNRLSCIKLGEEVFPTLINLYGSCRHDSLLKVKVIDFFLLQLVLHNPNGAWDCNEQALGFKWTTWKCCIEKIYSLILTEIHQYLRQSVKNTQFFVPTDDNTVILDSFVLLFVETCRQLFNNNTELPIQLCDESQPQKRIRLEVSLESFIAEIQDTKSWVWVKLVAALLHKYPKLIDRALFLKLLQVLHTIQLEVRDNNTISCIYEAQAILIDIEELLDVSDQAETVHLWTLVGDSTLRAVGLNQNIKETQLLLRKLICRNIIKVESVMQTYTSGVLITTEHHLGTLQLVLEYTNFAQLPVSRKEELFNSLLNVPNIKNYRCLLKRNFAEVLVALTLRHCPDFEKETKSDSSMCAYRRIAALYAQSSFSLEQILIHATPMNEAAGKRSFNVDNESVEILLRKLKIFVDSLDSEPLDRLLCSAGLLYNVASCMLDYQVIQEVQLQRSPIMNLIKNVLSNNSMLSLERYQVHSDNVLKELRTIVLILDEVFSLNNSVTKTFKELVSVDFLKGILQVLEFFQTVAIRKAELEHAVKKLLVSALSKFCLVSNSVETAQHQHHIAEMLAEPDYDFKKETDCDLVICFLQCVKLAPPGSLTDDVIGKILECLHKICQSTYRCYESAEIILGILAGLFQHVQHVDTEYKVAAVRLLYPFYLRRAYYGPDVVVVLLDAIEELCTVDPNCFYSRWDGKEVIKYVPEFLASNFQRVRYRAVSLLVKYLKMSSGTTQLELIHLSEELFNLIYDWNSKVFEVTEDFNEERLQDEIAFRASSALYTFLAIIVNCDSWIEESLFAIIRLEHDKGLYKISNGDLITKALKALQQHFGSKDVVKTYVDCILNNWLDSGYNIDDFQYRILGCSDKAELYIKFLDICLPLLIQKDRDALFAAAEQLGMTKSQVLEQCCTKIFGRAISRNLPNLRKDFWETNLDLSYISQVLGSRFREILVEHIDEVVLSLIADISDEGAIVQSLGETVFFTSKVISLSDFQSCLRFIETSICGGNGLIQFLTKGKINKVQKVILDLQYRIYGARIDQLLKYFHQYTVFINLILESVNKECIFLTFFLRDTVYFLINLLNNKSAHPKLSKAILRYTIYFLRSVLLESSNEFKQFFIFTVNSFKYISIENETLSPLCIDILELLIITHEGPFLDVIEKLDAFPITAKFQKIQEKHSAIKHSDRVVSLENEIKSFLDYNELTTRQYSLAHLKKMLAKEKEQLRQLYDKLSEVRGFSEDCEHSLLHRLTTMLIKISCHHCENISQEAIKCLGELGPANLTTIVLEPEKRVLNIKCTPFELLTGYVVSMLTQFIIDPDVCVVRTASDALYEVLAFKESKKIVGTSEDFGYGAIDTSLIAPFINGSQDSTSQVRIDLGKLDNIVNNLDLWCTSRVIESDEWITSLVLALLNSFDSGCYLKNLVGLCTVKAKFCENILPLLIYLMLSLNNELVTRVLSTQINEFFIQHWNLTVSTPTKENVIAVNKKSVKCMLDVINFIRQQPSVSSKLEDMKLDYLAIAKAAAFCSAHFSALLYAELWCQEKIADIRKQRESPKNGTLFENGFTFLDHILETVSEEVRVTFQQILQISYKSIGDVDALSGCGISLLLLPEHRVEYYKNTGQWDRVMDYHLMHSTHDASLNTDDLLLSFKMNRLYQMPLLCQSESREPDYECLWRLGQWKMCKMNNMKLRKIDYKDYEQYKFTCLKAVCDNDQYTFSIAKKHMNASIIDKLKHTSLESSQSLYPIFSQLQSLIEVEDSLELIEGFNVDGILAKWKMQDLIIRKNDFQFVEPIVAQRITLLSEFSKKEPKLRNAYFEMVLNFVDYAKDECHIKVAENALTNIRKMPDLEHAIENELQLRKVQLVWLNGDKLIAQQLLRKITKSTDITPRLKAKSLMLQGIYMAEMYSDRASILNSFESSLHIYERMENSRTTDDCKNLEDAYDKFATFADREYQQIMTHIKSDLFQKKLSIIQSCKQMALALQKQKQKTDDEKKARAINEKQIRIDENEIQTAFTDKDLVLQIALKHYINNLVASDLNNIKIFRLMALFIENKDNKIVIKMLQNMIPKVSSYKYIPMLPQLIPHITNNQHDLFGQEINKIIELCSIEHPYHTLPLLLALVNANKDREYTNSKKISANDRSITAIAIIKKLRKTDLRQIVDRMLKMSEALIEFAYYVPEQSARKNSNEFAIPTKYKIHSVKRFEDVLVPTCTVPPSKTNSYSNIEGIYKFNTKYRTVGGINAPKRIECVGTSGQIYWQLVKGQDDLRQDAVMQQVFRIITDLLSSNKQTKSLRIRTYKVVPLSMRSGILEWVANSMPIGDYLSGSNETGYIGAHREFRPKDKSPNDCKNLLKACYGKSNDVKLATYLSICERLQPVFHKFFEAHFRQPSVWYERRRAYIHSVATTSMCGYVLGLGDRHVSNILIDKQTAEVIHIDFGIAFEQGKCLPTPELVPFRLTRDIVDGMGASGIEGLFRKSCEKTMEVLRSNSQTILTILEVLLYDPLYFWTVSAAEAKKRQTEDETYKSIADEAEEENKNLSAERTLLRLQGKLQGTEQGKPTSIEQQVGNLIQQAMDPANLSRLYFGWQPYL